jgi:uncharacterized membrane protein
MAELEENGNGTEETVESVAEEGRSAVGGAADTLRNVTGGDGVPKKVWIPATVAALTAAAGYAAAKSAPKVRDAALSKTEDAAESVASEAERKGGLTGTAAKLLRKTGGEGGGGMLSGVTEAVTSKLPGGDKEPTRGWGKGRRNPIQRWVDVAVPLQTAYNQWTQFEEFPKFMHRVLSVRQDEEERQKLHWEEKIWFARRQWEAEIVEQIPDERIKWRTVSGTSHVGQVTFHRLDDELTRVMISMDFQPSGLIEKMGSGLRFAKRAAESDLARFKAFIETHGQETGAWRGRIEDGEVVRDVKVKEGKPFEEGRELHTPEGIGEAKKPKRGGDRASADGRQAEGARGRRDDRENEEREKDRRQREERREERRKQVAATAG